MDFRKTGNNFNENRQITDSTSENRYDMRRIYFKSDKPVVRGPSD